MQGCQPCPASLHAFPETIALLAEDGQLVSLGEDLEERTSPASSKGSPLLLERGTYVLVKIISKWTQDSPLWLYWNIRGTTGHRPHKALLSPPLTRT